MTARTRIRNARLWSTAIGLALLGSACTSVRTAGTPSAPTPGGTEASPAPSATRLMLRAAPFRLRAPVQREVAVSDGSTIYLAGGLDATGSSVAGVFALNPLSGSLTYLGSLPRPFHDGAGALVAGRIVVFGGGASTTTDLVQAFDPSSGRARVIGRLPRPLSDLAAATVDGTAYLVGGWDGSTVSTTIYATTDGVHFRVAGKLPIGVRYPAVAALPSGLLIAGGEDAAGRPVGDVWRFDPSTGQTSKVTDLPQPVEQAAAFGLGAEVYVVGGLDANGEPSGSTWAIDPSTGRTAALPPLRRPLADAAVALTPGQAWLIGGWRGTAVAEVEEATLVTATPAASSLISTTPTAGGSDPASVRPFAGKLLIADRGNNRLLVVDAKGRVLWRYPDPSLPAPPVPFFFPDDAFWVHRGRAILVNEEDNDVLAEIAYPSGGTLWTYGHPRVPGSAPGYVHQPDDLYPYPGGGMVVADASNCRILFFGPAGRPAGQIGRTGNCTPGLPITVGYPNGDTPLPDGHLLVTELHAGSISEITRAGDPLWTVRIPSLSVPSDPQRLSDGTYVAADYGSPGAVVRFTSGGRVLWTFRPTSGPRELDHPSLAAPLPNGLVAVTDDFNDRVVLLDPASGRIAWQYGHTNVPGTAPGFLNTPDGLDLLLPGGRTPLHVDFASARVHPGRP